MIGKHQLVIDASDFLKGMSTNDDLNDGGFSTASSAGLNPQVTPGMLYADANAADADTDTRLTDEIIASSSDDDNLVASYQRKMVTEDGKYYRYNGTKIPEAALRTDATYTYAKGFTDMVSYGGEMYVTTKETLVRWDETAAVFNTAFVDLSAVTVAIADSCPHPMVVFENNLYVASAHMLLRTVAAGTAPTVLLTLSSDQIIYALGIDPSTGKMLIATTNAIDVSNVKSHIHKIHWYDGFSNKVLKTIIVEDMVTAFHSVGGTVFVGYGNKLGYLTGSGINYLRTLANVTLAVEDLPWKHNFANIGNTLYVVDGTKILAFGEIAPGRKVFWYAYVNEISGSTSNKFKSIFPVGNNKLGLSVATAKFDTLDITDTSTMGANAFEFISNWYYFPRPVQLKTAYIENKSSASSANYTIQYKSENQSSYQNLSQLNGTQTSFQVKDISGFLTPVMAAKFKIANSNQNSGFKRMIIYYDVAE